ncbi:hypothetical protein BAC7755_00980 [Bacillus sp. MN7755]
MNKLRKSRKVYISTLIKDTFTFRFMIKKEVPLSLIKGTSFFISVSNLNFIFSGAVTLALLMIGLITFLRAHYYGQNR